MLYVPRRSRLAFPAGVAPGFNQEHVVANGTQISAIPRNIGAIDLLTGIPGITSNPGNFGAPGIDGIIGPFLNGQTNILMQWTVANLPNLNPPNPITFGFVFKLTATTATQLIYFGSGSDGWRIDVSTTVALVSNGVVNTGNSFTLAANVPYFLAMSANDTAVNSVLVNLSTGQTFTDTKSVSGNTAITLVSTDGFMLGYGNTVPVAAGMMANAFHGMNDLLQWAADPWSFWYPRGPSDKLLVGSSFSLIQNHFRFRTDTGAVDATPTWGAAQDST